MARLARPLPLAIAGAVLVALVAVAALAFRPPTDAASVVTAFTAARNAGDVDAAMALLAERGNILDFAMSDPKDRAALRAAFEAQAAAHWRIEDTDCSVDGAVVTCHYSQADDVMRHWGLAVTGTHRYSVQGGKILSMRRSHDRESADALYARTDAFRAWVVQQHPELVEVIWVDPTSALYTTPEGFEAILGILEEYDAATSGAKP